MLSHQRRLRYARLPDLHQLPFASPAPDPPSEPFGRTHRTEGKTRPVPSQRLLQVTGSRDRFVTAVLANPIVTSVPARAEELQLPDRYLATGCLFQTVWNELHGFDCQYAINDYDLIYFDGTDLSWEAGDLVIQQCFTTFGDLPAEIEVRNQARVHLWYEDHFGAPCPPLRSSAAAIDTYAAHVCRLGLRKNKDHVDVYAPSGFDDLFDLVVRPNPVVAPRDVYETKSSRWAYFWPRLRVLPWPDAEQPTALYGRKDRIAPLPYLGRLS